MKVIFYMQINIKDMERSNSSVIRQKGKSQKGRYKKTKYTKFSQNEHFLPPDKHTCMNVSRGKKSSIFEKFDVLCFLVTPVLRFNLLPTNYLYNELQYLFIFGLSKLVRQRPVKSLSSVGPSVHPSLSFLKIESLVFSDIVHDDS